MKSFSLFLGLLLLSIATDSQAQVYNQKPIIGVSVSNTMKGTCTRSIELAGGIPLIIPESADSLLICQTLDLLDGLLMTGGEDVNPSYYGEEVKEKCEEINDARDRYEMLLLKKAIDRNVPVFGICRGLQIINVAMGGSLYQDIPSEKPSDVNHRPGTYEIAHDVTLVPGTEVARIFEKESFGVNSRHHQGIKKLAPGLTVSAWSADSIPEAVEAYPIKNILAVQWHPEIDGSKGSELELKYFKAFVEKASLYKKAKEIHSRILSIDTHTDGPMWWGGRRNYGLGDYKDNQVSIPKMQEGKLDAQFLAAFLSQKERDDESLKKAVEKCQGLITSIYQQVAKYSDVAGIAVTEADARALKSQGKRAFFIGIENGYGIGKDIKNIKRFYDQGVNYITLCHSYDNDICHSSTHTEDENLGLTEFGKQVVKEMNRVGMLIDLSHASMGTFWDVIKLSTKPILCSHSGAKGVFFHNRNLNDDQLRALTKNGGVIQVCIFASYMTANPKKTDVNDVVAHIDHCVKVAGIDHVGIGSDFDGGGGVLGCAGDNDMIQITMKLLEKGYTEEQLNKIWGANFFRVLNANRGK